MAGDHLDRSVQVRFRQVRARRQVQYAKVTPNNWSRDVVMARVLREQGLSLVEASIVLMVVSILTAVAAPSAMASAASRSPRKSSIIWPAQMAARGLITP